MSIHKGDNSRPFMPQIHPKKRRGQNRQNFFRNRNRSFSRDRQRQNVFDATVGENHKTDAHNMDMIVVEELIDIKFIIIEMTVEMEGDKALEETLIMTEMKIGRGVGQDKEV